MMMEGTQKVVCTPFHKPSTLGAPQRLPHCRPSKPHNQTDKILPQRIMVGGKSKELKSQIPLIFSFSISLFQTSSSQQFTTNYSNMPLHTAGPTQIYTFPDTAALSQGLDKYVAKLSAEAIQRHGKFTVALSGGSLPKQLSAVLKHNNSVDFVSIQEAVLYRA